MTLSQKVELWHKPCQFSWALKCHYLIFSQRFLFLLPFFFCLSIRWNLEDVKQHRFHAGISSIPIDITAAANVRLKTQSTCSTHCTYFNKYTYSLSAYCNGSDSKHCRHLRWISWLRMATNVGRRTWRSTFLASWHKRSPSPSTRPCLLVNASLKDPWAYFEQ